MPWLNIVKNEADPSIATVQILDQIGYDWWTDSGTEAVDFMAAVRDLGELNEVTLEINSPGGNVHEGVSIANFIKGHSATWNAVVIGQAASIATVIASACATIEMGVGTNWLVHKPASALFNFATANEFRKLADQLDVIESSIIDFYLPRIEAAGKTKDELLLLLEEDRYMTSTEAIEWGFVDSSSVDIKAAACVDFKAAFNSGSQHYLIAAKDGRIKELEQELSDIKPISKEGIQVYFDGETASIEAEEVINAINKKLSGSDFFLINNKPAPADFISKSCAENGLDHLINDFIQSGKTKDFIDNVIQQSEKIKTLCVASGIDSKELLKNISDPVEMLRHAIINSSALAEPELDPSNSSGNGEAAAKTIDVEAIYKSRNNTGN